MPRRHEAGRRTARENVDDLLDDGSFIEYGAGGGGQRSRRTPEELTASTPADGLIAGIGTVNATQFGRERRAAW